MLYEKASSLIDKQIFRTEFQHNIQNPKATCFTAGRFFVPENCADARFWGNGLGFETGTSKKGCPFTYHEQRGWNT